MNSSVMVQKLDQFVSHGTDALYAHDNTQNLSNLNSFSFQPPQAPGIGNCLWYFNFKYTWCSYILWRAFDFEIGITFNDSTPMRGLYEWDFTNLGSIT